MMRLLRLLFGCSHGHTTWPQTPKRRPGIPDSERRGTYVVCLDCNKSLAYDWKDMKIGREIR
jgi:hypothetical protein